MTQRITLFSALFLLPACIGDGPIVDTQDTTTSGDDTGQTGDGPIRLDEAPPESSVVRVHGDSGAFLREETFGETWTSSMTSGVLSIATQTSDQTQLQISLWEPTQVGSWPVEMAMGLPTNANVVFIESDGKGGQASGGTLTITKWQETDSANIMLLTGTLDAGPIVNPDDPTWVRDLRDGTLTAIRVAVF
jgi:hypothetical protein